MFLIGFYQLAAFQPLSQSGLPGTVAGGPWFPGGVQGPDEPAPAGGRRRGSGGLARTGAFAPKARWFGAVHLHRHQQT